MASEHTRHDKHKKNIKDEGLFDRLADISEILSEDKTNLDELYQEAESIKKKIGSIRNLDRKRKCQTIVVYGDILFEYGKCREAVTCYKKGLKLVSSDEDRAEICYSIGACYVKARKYKLAIDYYNKTIKLKKALAKQCYYASLLGLAYCYGAQYDFNKSNNYLVNVIESISNPADELENIQQNIALSLLITNYWDADNEFAGEKYFDELLKKNDVEPLLLSKAYCSKGYCYYEKQIWLKAKESFEKASNFDEDKEDKEYYQKFINYCAAQEKKSKKIS